MAETTDTENSESETATQPAPPGGPTVTNSSTNPPEQTGHDYDGAATTAELPSLDDGKTSTDPSQHLDDSGSDDRGTEDRDTEDRDSEDRGSDDRGSDDRGSVVEAAEQTIDNGPDSGPALDGGSQPHADAVPEP